MDGGFYYVAKRQEGPSILSMGNSFPRFVCWYDVVEASIIVFCTK